MSETPNRTRPVLNRVIFALLTLVLGGLAGAFVWVFFFLLNHGINLFWRTCCPSTLALGGGRLPCAW